MGGEAFLTKLALVTGGTGKIGPALIQALINKGYRVRVLVRSGNSRERLCFDNANSPVGFIRGDVTNLSSLRLAVKDVDVVFHLAALLHDPHPDASMRKRYHDVNVGGTRNVLTAAMKANVRRFVHYSTISVYGPGDRALRFVEESPANPEGIYAVTKHEAEAVVREFNSKPGRSPWVSVLRLASVYGGHMTGNYLYLVNALQKGVFAMPGKGGALRTLVHEKDVATASVLAAIHADAPGKTYNLTDGDIHSLKDIAEAIQNAIKRKTIILCFPERPLRCFADVGAQYFAAKNDSILRSSVLHVKYLLDKLTENVAVDGSKIQRELGFLPAFDLRKGWTDALRSLHARPSSLSFLA